MDAFALAAIALLAVGGAGCGSGSSAPASTSRATAGTAATAADPAGAAVVRGRTGRVAMQTLAFAPVAVRARVGQRIVWRNQDSTRHNVTYVSGPLFRSSRPDLGPGATFSIRLTQAGTIRYVCTIHPWMKGTIIVSR